MSGSPSSGSQDSAPLASSARMAATRATLTPASPAGWPQPIIRSSTSWGSSWGTFSSAALTIVALRSSGRHSTSDPFMARPMGLRAVETMTASGMDVLLRVAPCCLRSYRWSHGRAPPGWGVPVGVGVGVVGVGVARSVAMCGSPSDLGPSRLEPALEAGGVGVDAVERLELLALGRVGALELARELPGQRFGDVVAVAPRGLGHLGPPAQRALGLLEDLDGIGHQPEVGERDAGGSALDEALQRGERLVEIEVGRRRRRAQHADVGQAHAHRIAGEQQPRVRVVQRQVVLGVPRRIDRGERAVGRDGDLLTVGQHVDALGRRRGEPPVEGVEQVAVDHCRAVDELGGVDQVPSAPLVDVDGGVGERGGHVAHAPRVVEVDVGDRDAGELAGVDPEVDQGGEQRRYRRLAAGLDQHGGITCDEVAGRDLLPAAEQGVDLQDSGSDLAVHRVPFSPWAGLCRPADPTVERRRRYPSLGSGRMVRRPTPTAQTLWDDPAEPTLSVSEVGEVVAGALRRAFPDEVWLRGVIRNLTRGRAGMVWFDLVEPAPGGDLAKPAVATLPVVLFDDERRRVNARLREGGNAVRMDDGTEVRIRGRLDYWPRGGRLQLQMSDIDTAFTLGQLAAERDRLLRLLRAEGLLDRQAGLARPALPLRLGLVTSGGSAAEHDVLDELRRSRIGFHDVRAFERHAFEVWRGVAAAVGRHLRAEDDRLRTCGRNVAVAKRQGLSGADRDLSGRAMRVRRSATGALARSALAVERSVGRAESGARAHLRGHDQVLAAAAERLVQRPPRLLAGGSPGLATLDPQVRALDPARSLARG